MACVPSEGRGASGACPARYVSAAPVDSAAVGVGGEGGGAGLQETAPVGDAGGQRGPGSLFSRLSGEAKLDKRSSNPASIPMICDRVLCSLG